MAADTAPSIPDLPIDSIDDWLNDSAPSPEDAAGLIRKLRRTDAQVRLVRSHLVGYVRYCFELDELDDDPPILVEAEQDDPPPPLDSPAPAR